MLAALCLAMVFAISLSSYIALCYVSLSMSTRSVMSSHCLELAEAGIEQALYMQNNSGGNWTAAGWTVTAATPQANQTSITATMTMTANGMIQTSTGPTPLNFGNGAQGLANITVITDNITGLVVQITSQGQIILPNGSATNTTAVTNLTRTLTYYAPTPITVPPALIYPYPYTPYAPVFVNAVAATTNRVQFRAAGTVDSYDSISSSGAPQPYSAAVAGWSAVVLSQNVSSAAVTVQLNDAVINGYVAGYDYSSPASTNWLSYGGSGMVVGKTSAGFIDSSRILTTPVPYQPRFLESIPSPGLYTNLGNVTGTSTLGLPIVGGIYKATGITLVAGDVLTIDGPTVIVDSGALTMTGSAQIILTQGASLALFVEGGSAFINCTGAGGITNSSSVPLAKNFALMSTNNPISGNTVSLTQQVPFYGVIYFPYRKVTIGNTGAGAAIYGSIVGDWVVFTASPVIHYDVALRKPDSTRGDVAFNYLSAPVAVGNLITSAQ
jgi:hypothetical protein